MTSCLRLVFTMLSTPEFPLSFGPRATAMLEAPLPMVFAQQGHPPYSLQCANFPPRNVDVGLVHFFPDPTQSIAGFMARCMRKTARALRTQSFLIVDFERICKHNPPVDETCLLDKLHFVPHSMRLAAWWRGP